MSVVVVIKIDSIIDRPLTAARRTLADRLVDGQRVGILDR